MYVRLWARVPRQNVFPDQRAGMGTLEYRPRAVLVVTDCLSTNAGKLKLIAARS